MLCLVSSARSAAAQQLRGIARDSSTSAPLPGVVISAVDSIGATLSRTIADASGRFSLTLPTRAVRVRAIRIGYRPRDLLLPMGGSSLEFAMTRIPPMLDAIRVTDRELCPGSTDRGSAFQLWEQARAGLLASVVAREANPATATSVTFERRTIPGDELVRRQRVELHTGTTTRPFAAAAAASQFAAQGYLRDIGGDRLFLAPDADVLLDESFAATHCFHLQVADAGHADQIGLAFVPVPGRPDSLVDVSGVIWIDRTEPALRSFDFRYTNLEPAAVRAEAGGHLEFRNVSNGVSFIQWWSLRLPVLTQVMRSIATTPLAPAARRQDRRDMRATEIQESGGQVLQAKWQDGTSWREEPTGITGTLTQRSGTTPIPNALVTLTGTADTTSTDDQGNFSLTTMVPGRYSVVVADTTLGAFTPPRTESRVVDVRRGQVTELRAQLTSARDAIAQICRGQRLLPHTTTIAGRVILPDGSPPSDGVVRATWQSDYGLGGDVVSIASAERSITLDSEGRFLLCGVVLERPVNLRLTSRAGIADTTVRSYETLLKSVEWRPTPRPPR
jgi:hypothetical protein